jgi:hypothetical protein
MTELILLGCGFLILLSGYWLETHETGALFVAGIVLEILASVMIATALYFGFQKLMTL